MGEKLIVGGYSRFIEAERWYARKKRMKIRINDLARNRVDGIERMDQVRRERATDGTRGRGVPSGWTGAIRDQERETWASYNLAGLQLLLCASGKLVRAAGKKFAFPSSRLRVIYS